MVYKQRVAFHNAVHGEVAPITGIRDLSVFQTFDGDLNRVDCRSSGFQYVHAQSGSTRIS
jgi:hypothetical protein